MVHISILSDIGITFGVCFDEFGDFRPQCPRTAQNATNSASPPAVSSKSFLTGKSPSTFSATNPRQEGVGLSRLDGSVDFYRNWTDYKQGFGNLGGEFWLGLDNIHRLTNQTNNTLRVELEDFDGNTAYAEYNTFAVADEADNYRLSVAGYTGNHEVWRSLINSVVLLTDSSAIS